MSSVFEIASSKWTSLFKILPAISQQTLNSSNLQDFRFCIPSLHTHSHCCSRRPMVLNLSFSHNVGSPYDSLHFLLSNFTSSVTFKRQLVSLSLSHCSSLFHTLSFIRTTHIPDILGRTCTNCSGQLSRYKFHSGVAYVRSAFHYSVPHCYWFYSLWRPIPQTSSFIHYHCRRPLFSSKRMRHS